MMQQQAIAGMTEWYSRPLTQPIEGKGTAMRYDVTYNQKTETWAVVDRLVSNQTIGQYLSMDEALDRIVAEEDKWNRENWLGLQSQ